MLPFDLTWMHLAACMAAFAVAGFIDAIAGGGGLITMPSLLLAGLPPHVALGTGKLASMLGSLTSLATYLRNGLVILKIAPIGFCASFLGSAFGAWLTTLLDSAVLGRVLIGLLPVGLLLSLATGKATNDGGPLPGSWLRTRVCLIGFLIGAYDGFFGPGTGSFFIIAFNLLLSIQLVRASATAKVMNLASNFGAACTFASCGVVAYAVSLPCAAASILGNFLGTRMAIKYGAGMVRRFLYAVLTLLLATLIHKYFLAA